MSFFWSSTLKDLRRQLTDRFSMAFWLGIPLAIGGLLVLAFGGGDTVPKARVLVADEDSSFVSTLFTGALSRFPVVTSEHTDRATGLAEVEKGRATALLVVPRGFGAAVLAGDSVTLTMRTNPSQRILPSIAEESVGVLADATWYVQRQLRPAFEEVSLEALAGRASASNEAVAATSVRINELSTRLKPYVDPPVLAIETPAGETPAGPPGGMGALFLPGILFMSLLFAGQGMSTDVWEEAQSGTLRRVAATPHGIGVLFGGKLMAAAVVMTAISTGAAAIGARFFAVPLERLPLAVVWSTFAGVCFLCLLLLLQTLASVRSAANMLVTFILFPLLMVGGSFFPMEALPSALRAVGRWTPNGWAVVELQAILRGEPDPARLATGAVVLAAVSAAIFALAVARIRQRFVRA